MSGALARSNFGTADEQEHYWFRARLVQRLAANAAHNVLFPRPELDHDLRELLGIERTAEPQRYTVVPEGIDLAVTASAEVDVLAVAGGARTEGLVELDRLIGRLPEHRRGLPVAISVGRLHRTKGMAAVVEAWAGHPDVRERCNLVIVGGDLSEPSPDEKAQLERIQAVLAADPTTAHGLVLAGHRPNGIVAQWLAAAHRGLPPNIGPGGVYVCGSLKEEFGLAILEALAAGLVVVAPAGGGPATYVEQGGTGVLVDTQSPAELATGLLAALGLAAEPTSERRAETAKALVRERFTVQAMARTLAGVYVGVSAPAHR
jgi:glycosyltransferase involved in cell wall biosynthesis